MALDFGDQTTCFAGGARGQTSNATRMLIYGGSNPSSDHRNINYVPNNCNIR